MLPLISRTKFSEQKARSIRVLQSVVGVLIDEMRRFIKSPMCLGAALSLGAIKSELKPLIGIASSRTIRDWQRVSW